VWFAQDIEALQRQVEELQAANDKLDKSKKKLQAELEDSNIDLEAQRAKVLELEKKQRNFDKVLAEEKVMGCVQLDGTPHSPFILRIYDSENM
jgi:myosin protein heavy chain